MTVNPSPHLPPVAAEVAAGALDLLPARLRKRVDGALAKLAGWPVESVPDGVRVRVDEETSVTLRTTGGIVARAEDAVCGCLLAPACLHRAAVLSGAPLAEPSEPEPEPEPEAETAPEPFGGDTDGRARGEESTGGGSPGGGASGGPVEGGPALTPAQVAAIASLRAAATSVLVTGVAGAGAVHRAELLHAAHSGRLAGLPLPAAAAVRIARRLGEARSDDPAFRLPELCAELAGLLDLLRRPADAVTPARRSYRPAGPLRLYGLFTEPVVTASGYAGATAYGMAPDGTLHTVSDIAPGGPERAAQASGTPVPGGCALPLREWGDGGAVILTGPTVSPEGRIGGGTRIRSVRAAGARWHEPPLDALWRRPPAEQLSRALGGPAEPVETRQAGGDLLFLTGTVTGGGFRVAGGPLLRLLAPDERAELAYAENLRLLASRPGLRLRLIARAVADRPGAVQALAAAWTGHDGETVRADLGLRRLNRSHLPPPGAPGTPGTPGTPSAPSPTDSTDSPAAPGTPTGPHPAAPDPTGPPPAAGVPAAPDRASASAPPGTPDLTDPTGAPVGPDPTGPAGTPSDPSPTGLAGTSVGPGPTDPVDRTDPTGPGGPADPADPAGTTGTTGPDPVAAPARAPGPGPGVGPVPGPRSAGEPDGPGSPAIPAVPVELELLRRAVDRAVAGGRAVTAAAADGELPRRLRAVGLTTGAECARALAETAADRRHDALGRLLPADPDAFAAAWLAASVYASAATRSLLPAAWSAGAAEPGRQAPAPEGR
ncbi:hypothetical protein [Streptomyces sp. NPDC014894]|uniref:hypothetical protein n=1 Tax=Streptomyces sp. NPDC014894 TaxID=3364931 RepID=UPI0037001AC8